MLSIYFKVRLQVLTAQSAVEVELVAAGLTMKEAVLFTSKMQELGLKDAFNWDRPFIDNTSALHVAENLTYSPQAKHIAPRYFLIQELVAEHDHHPLPVDARPTC